MIEIISLVEAQDKERLIKTCSDLRLFKAYDLAKGKDSFCGEGRFDYKFKIINHFFDFRLADLAQANVLELGGELFKAIEVLQYYIT